MFGSKKILALEQEIASLREENERNQAKVKDLEIALADAYEHLAQQQRYTHDNHSIHELWGGVPANSPISEPIPQPLLQTSPTKE